MNLSNDFDIINYKSQYPNIYFKSNIDIIKHYLNTNYNITSTKSDNKSINIINNNIIDIFSDNNIINNNIIDNNIIDKYIIHHKIGGGTTKYVYDLINKYKCILIERKNNMILKKGDILLVQHLYGTDITIDDLLNINKDIKIIITIHDWYWLINDINKLYNMEIEVHNRYLNENIIINDKIIQLFKKSYKIIHPTRFTYEIFEKYIDMKNHIIIPHNDYLLDISNNSIYEYKQKYIKKIRDNIINIGNLNGFGECKGSNYIMKLYDKYNEKKYKDNIIKFHIVDRNISYNELEYFDIINDKNINGLLQLNKWGETWCYSLTKALYTNLPILYTNIGAFKYRINESNHYICLYEKEIETDILYEKFEKFLDYIIENNDKYEDKIIKKPTIIYNDFYNDLLK